MFLKKTKAPAFTQKPGLSIGSDFSV